MDNIESKAREILERYIGKGAEFREGQLDAIKATREHKRTLVVQRTGWGKSMVYFICARMLRDEGKGMTIVVSPLLSLMANQMMAAQNGYEANGEEKNILKAAVINGGKSADLSPLDDDPDIVFTTPETLKGSLSKLVEEKKLDVGLLVLDEVHCITEWGHDFRLSYSELGEFIKQIPDVPILATTATASQGVIEDLKKQLGIDDEQSGKKESLHILPGKLMRRLYIQTLDLPEKKDRYAWLLDNLPKLIEKGPGIIYCLTTNDCDELAKFLRKHRIKARAYHAKIDKQNKNYENIKNILDIPDDDVPPDDVSPDVKKAIYDRISEEEIEEFFRDDKIDVLVATTKLGMGYDKQNIAFVIHYQTPGSIVAYYQQMGRARRDEGDAYTFLMNGEEDKRIQKYFREKAFPTMDEMKVVYETISKESNSSDYKNLPLKNMDHFNKIMDRSINMDKQRIRKALDFLAHEKFIEFKDDNRYYVKPDNKYDPNKNYNSTEYDDITARRELEYKTMEKLVETDQCYNRYIVNELEVEGEKTTTNCGVCANCLRRTEFPSEPTQDSIKAASDFIENNGPIITDLPVQRPDHIPGEEQKADEREKFYTINKTKRPQTGIGLSWRYQSPFGKYIENDMETGKFKDILVEKSAERLRSFIEKNKIDALTYVPSRDGRVEDLAKRLADKLGIPCLDLLKRADTQGLCRQKELKNATQKYHNAWESFDDAGKKLENSGEPGKQNLLLVDDLIDSGWTMSTCAYLLIKDVGAENVYPFALAVKNSIGD